MLKPQEQAVVVYSDYGRNQLYTRLSGILDFLLIVYLGLFWPDLDLQGGNVSQLIVL